MLTRLVASSSIGRVLSCHAAAIQSSVRCAEGRACLRNWQLEQSDVVEWQEALLHDAGLYDSDGAMSDDDT